MQGATFLLLTHNPGSRLCTYNKLHLFTAVYQLHLVPHSMHCPSKGLWNTVYLQWLHYHRCHCYANIPSLRRLSLDAGCRVHFPPFPGGGSSSTVSSSLEVHLRKRHKHHFLLKNIGNSDYSSRPFFLVETLRLLSYPLWIQWLQVFQSGICFYG